MHSCSHPRPSPSFSWRLRRRSFHPFCAIPLLRLVLAVCVLFLVTCFLFVRGALLRTPSRHPRRRVRAHFPNVTCLGASLLHLLLMHSRPSCAKGGHSFSARPPRVASWCSRHSRVLCKLLSLRSPSASPSSRPLRRVVREKLELSCACCLQYLRSAFFTSVEVGCESQPLPYACAPASKLLASSPHEL